MGGQDHRLQVASVLSCETLDTKTGFVANTFIGKSHTIVSTSRFAGPCQRAPLSGPEVVGADNVDSAVFDVTNSKCSRQRSDNRSVLKLGVADSGMLMLMCV
jgi:hypothetical protein